MKVGTLSVILLSMTAVLISGCSDSSNKRAKELYTEASQALQLNKNGNSSYSDAVNSYQRAKRRIDCLLSDYPSSDIAVKLSSGGTTVSGLTLSQFRELEDSLNELAEAERHPLSCALLVAKTIEVTSSRSIAMARIAGKYAEAGQREQALHLLSQALEVAKTNTWPDLRLWCAIAGKYAEAGQQEQASRILAETLIAAQTLKRIYDDLEQNGPNRKLGRDHQ